MPTPAAPRANEPYSARVIKAGALREDTRAFLGARDTAVSPRQNLLQARANNIFGKASRARVRDVLAALRQRYLARPAEANALAAFVQGGWDATALDRVLLFSTA